MSFHILDPQAIRTKVEVHIENVKTVPKTLKNRQETPKILKRKKLSLKSRRKKMITIAPRIKLVREDLLTTIHLVEMPRI